MADYDRALSMIMAMLNDPAAFSAGQPPWKSPDGINSYLTAKGYRRFAASPNGTSRTASQAASGEGLRRRSTRTGKPHQCLAEDLAK